MMEESADEAMKREEMLKQYHACKEAMRIISDVSMNTVSVPAPPPVKSDWMPKPSMYVHSCQLIGFTKRHMYFFYSGLRWGIHRRSEAHEGILLHQLLGSHRRLYRNRLVLPRQPLAGDLPRPHQDPADFRLLWYQRK